MAVYPPLSDVRNSLRIKWYRCQIDHDRLKQLSTRSDKQGWKQAGGHVGLYVVFVAITLTMWAQQIWPAFVVALWCLGFIATFFKGTSAHELGHGTVFRTKYLNTLFLKLVCLISWWDPYDYSASHTYHHRFTIHSKADRENLLPLTPSLAPLLVLQLLTFNLFLKPGRNFGKGGFLWTIYLTARRALGMSSGHAEIPSQEWLEKLHADQPETFRDSVRWSRTLVTFHTTVLVLSILTGWWVLPLVVTCPSYIANIGSYLLGTTQHCGLAQDSSDFRKNTRSIRVNPLLEFLYWHMNWHTEHHMYAGVPCYNLKALAKEIERDMPEPKSLFGAWVEMRKICKQQKAHPDFEHDTPVPGRIKSSGMPQDSEYVNSIGDLAPEGSEVR